MKAIDVAALLLLSSVWGSAFLFNHVAVRERSPLTLVAGRLIVASLALAPLALRSGGIMPQRAMWPALAFLAAFNNVVPFSLITAAQEHITSGLAATLVATMPLFTLVFAWASATERLSIERAVGLLVGFVGAAVLIGTDITDLTDSNSLADLAVVTASASYAMATVFARRTSAGSPLSLASGQMIIGSAMALPLALIFDGAPSGTPADISMKALLSVLALGAMCSGLAYIIFFRLVQRIQPTQLSVVSYIIPLVATLLGWVALDEPLGANLFAGLALILVGAVTVNGGTRAVWERLNGGSRRPRRDGRIVATRPRRTAP